MRRFSLVIIALAGLCCARAQGQVACPWLTEGTAATGLGGAPQLAVKLASPVEGSCVFTFQNEVTRSTLDITVLKQQLSTPDLSCPSGSPILTGIGNQAIICHLAAPSHGDKQLVISQVRDVHFRIVLTAEPKGATMPAIEQQRDRITMIAEQVAGNLF